jgi:hypothetical protein
MKFQIYGKDKKCKLVTESKACIPNIDELKLMSKAGYKFKLDGKAISFSKLKEVLTAK